MKSKLNDYRFYLVIFIVLLIDQFTKAIFQYKDLQIIPYLLSIKYAENPGIIFGLFENNAIFLFILPLIVICYVIYYLHKNELNWFGSALVIAGLLGNIIDRARLGYVIDWLFISIAPEYNISLFNIADASLVIGVIVLIYYINKEK